MKHKSTEIDSWLESLGYYRKNVGHDETCLFRAIAEQIYKTQMFHETVRKECIDYANNNRDEFDKYVDNWDDYLTSLKDHMVICGERELQIISQCYKHDVVIFDGANHECKRISDNYGKSIFLCLTNDDHYDTVYKMEFIQTAGFCQSIVYNVLYEKVFRMKEVDKIVTIMLYNKLDNKEIVYDENYTSEEEFLRESQDSGGDESKVRKVYTPFPFKVAKALDPDIYRNIELDSWNEFRKEWRVNNWYYGDKNFKIGTHCIVELDNNNNNKVEYHCYIQKLNPCVVYIEKLAVYKEVPYSKLKPLPNAKPWMLPYRYMKNGDNYNFSQTPTQPKNKKRNGKKKKKLQDNKVYEYFDDCNNNVYDYEGAPLNMTHDSNRSYHHNQVYPTLQTDLYLNNSQTNYWQYNFVAPTFPNNYYYNDTWPNMKPLCPQMLMGQTIQSHYNMFTNTANNFTYYTEHITKETIGIQQSVYGSNDYEQNEVAMTYMPVPPPTPTFICPPPSPQSIASYSPLPFSPGSPMMSPMISPIYPDTHFIFPPINGCESLMTSMQLHN